MKEYIGVKIIKAESMDECTFLKTKKGQDISNMETRLGYLVLYPDGYESWSPKEVFEEAYRLTCGMSFGLAVEAAKKGNCISRRGWNGKGMWVWHCDVNEDEKEWECSNKEIYTRVPYLYFKDSNDCVIPWVASQADILSDDWYIVE